VMGTRTKAVAALLVMFVLGTLTGAGVVHAFNRRHLALLVADSGGALQHEHRLRALRHALDLTDDQATRIERVLHERHAANRQAMVRMFATCGQPMVEMRKQLEAEILPILTSEQRARFRQFWQRHHGPLGDHP
jgi:hypothetical protein